jgi:hypothetical protein
MKSIITNWHYMGSVKRGMTIIITRGQEMLAQFTSHRKVLRPRYFIRESALTHTTAVTLRNHILHDQSISEGAIIRWR